MLIASVGSALTGLTLKGADASSIAALWGSGAEGAA
jgi:hypothetical protein